MATKNLEQAKKESKLPVSGDTLKLEIALKSQLIKDSSFEEVSNVLRKILIKLGLRAANWPQELETLVLYEHISENYGGNRLDELRLAFDMAIRGSLADEDGVVIDANCYENFSCLYVSKIMNGYRQWARQEFKYISPTEKSEQKIFSQEELDDSAREDTEVQYQMYLRNIEIKNEILNRPILEKDKLIKEDETVLDFFKRRALSGHPNIYYR